MRFKFQMRMGTKSLKWEAIGTKNLFPHISSVGLLTIDARINWKKPALPSVQGLVTLIFDLLTPK